MTEKLVGQKRGIRRKVILIICLSTFIVMAIGIAMGYVIGFNALRGMASDIHRKLSQLLAGQIAQKFTDEMERMQGYAAEPLWRDAILAHRPKDEASGERAKDYIAEMNTKWANADEDSPLVREYTQNSAAARLRAIVSKNEDIAELAVIDSVGGLVAASGKTMRLYITDGKLPKEFFADNAGKAFIGNVEYDEVPRVWVIPIFIPVKDADGRTIGIFRAKLSPAKFFAPLKYFRIDNTGHASVIDGRGNIVFHPGATLTNVKFYRDEDYRKLLTAKDRSATVYDINVHKTYMFVSFSDVTPPVLLESGKVWRILVEQNAKEVFKSLNKTAAWLVLAIMFLLVLMAVIGFIFSSFLVRPVLALYAAAIEIMKGNWDYKIDIRTGDEIEQFADAFKEMIATIKGKQAELLKTKNDFEELSKSLEKKVQARTIDLTMARDKLDSYAKELEKALQVKSDFVSMASHELRTPLAAIKEGIGIILDGKTGPVNEQQMEFLDMAKRNVDRLARLINDILDFQKLEYGKMVINIRENDINEVISEVCAMMMHVAKEKDLELNVSLGTDIPKISFDKDKIIQVVTNLISNAINFTEKGAVTVATSRDNNIVKVAVTDTGIGIRQEDVPWLFQKFTQLEKGLERKPGGTGLGLTISKEIIEKHKGKIWAESKFGKGTTFYFVLPIRERRAYDHP